MTNTKEYLQSWATSYKNDLTENILPFWLQNGLDKKHGGVYTCLDRKGSLMDTTKSVWFQGRFAFVAATAYSEIEANPKYLEAAKSCIDFIEKYCFDSDGRMYFEITQDGRGIRKRRYVFSESFAVIAYAAYAKASKDDSFAHKALKLFKRMQYFLSTPNFLPSKYEDWVKGKGHSITMIMLNTAAQVRKVIKDPILDKQINDSIYLLKNDFLKPEFKALLESVGENGEFVDTLNGRLINPGHCIETAWFLLEEANYRNWDNDIKNLALTILDWSWDWGWDEPYGGIINFRDCKGFPCQDYAQDMKFWWPQTEAIIATLYAYWATNDPKYLKNHQLISDWTYKHFPDKEFGEWYGYLHRDGTIAQNAKGNIFKGPFHIPRMMIKGYELCNEILKQ
ncbi:AGE family epimerase/isomerase [Capnocytophaga catalasegens]|uniref:N-acylglucosamine 2-epimerase n=1 Tax=Capnocytophaga catalasegens TaxID=1004260 RepID=A0AAV5AZL3_9FLAO|nr:AGE family epimerase/isomerase [Capnocytophaga catalasegens]GIZ15388.1 N-acylglucosamine 2-epimerase [Capnocytophaga catalasegens]GJM50976.1 N-acylglucosamine 2-epimerase [Capnocytophaga catalasegens]GJM52160.1 N-acylglucosamine 2-epimerase [Capnocytophaga catalasegens]